LKLEHVIFAGFTHEPAITLCENLRTILPAALTRFFFSDNGSTAVEVALKMSVQYWKNKGFSGKTTLIALRGSYHGDTCGAMSLGFESGFHDHFSALRFPVEFIPFPETWIGDEVNVDLKEEKALSVMILWRNISIFSIIDINILM
jgi:adenosylmethionine-8-amino-7-oxononanoate aminotransferase